MSTSVINKKMSKIVDENPFYKMSGALDLLQQGSKLSDTATQQQVYSYLDNAWKECNSKEKKELFFVLLFSLGDINNREHNIFRKQGIKKPDQGGQAKRRVFILCLKWVLEKVPQQFYAFLPIIGEYYNLGGMMLYQLQTDRWKGNLEEVWHLNVDVATVTDYIAGVLKASITTDNEKLLWARWLPHVPSGSKRARKYQINEKNVKAFNKGGHEVKVGDSVIVRKDKKPYTQRKDAWVFGFIKMLSEKMNWKITKIGKGLHFEGYRSWRKKFLSETEAALFSSKRIVEMDKVQFFDWLDKQPSGARHRVACRLVSKDKAGKLAPRDKWKLNTGENMGQLYLDWVASKQVAQAKLASLTEVEKKEMKPEEMKQLKQAAKVNVGGETLIDLIADLAARKNSPQELDIKAFSLLEKIKIEVPVLVVTDISGSMAAASVDHKSTRFTAQAMAQLATTLFLLKNPDPDAGQFFIRFDNRAEVIVSGQQAEKQGVNKFMGKTKQVVGTLVDPTKSFLTNLQNVSSYVVARGGTELTSVARGLKEWVDETTEFRSQKIEMINKYPVMLVISDGDLNSHSNPLVSFQAFQNDMRQYFGWEGLVVMWDVKEAYSFDNKKFETAANLMVFGGTNPGVLNQIFLNIHDMDVIDPYLPLKAMFNSNRYEPVRRLVL